jgi:peroxiredoxin
MIHLATLALLMLLPAQTSPEQERLAEQVGSAIENLDSLSFEGELRQKDPYLLRAAAKTENREVRVSVSTKKGGKLRVEAFEKGERTWMILSDGRQIAEWLGQENSWTRYPMLDSEKHSWGRKLLINNAMGAAFFAHPFLDTPYGHAEWLRKVIAHPETKLLGKRKIGGRVYIAIENKHIEHQDDSALSGWMSETVRFYLDPESHLLVRYKQVASFGAGPLPLGKGSTDIRYTHIKPNADLPDDLFVFVPPEGSTFIDPDDPRFVEVTLEGKPAPDLSQPDLDGKPFTLADVKGKKAVLVVFWATWCGPCNKEMPFLIALHKEYAGRGVMIVGVSTDSSSSGLKAFVAKKGLPYLNLHDADGKASKLYGAKSIPRTFLIDPSGKVVKAWVGWSGEEEEKEILAELAKLLKEPP